jgi:hypothetical protein
MTLPALSDKAESVPKMMRSRYLAATALTDAFCTEHLNAEYATLARRALAALCRKRPSPLLSGQVSSWACGVIYALGQANFLQDKSKRPYMKADDLFAGFGVSPSTGAAKAKTVRDILGTERWDHRWLLSETLALLSPVWLLNVDGITVDIRAMPRPLQIAAYERGLIPYVPADGPDGDGGTREAILARYDDYRRLNSAHQTTLAQCLLEGSAAKIAVQLGLVEHEDEVADCELDEIAPALDLAIYGGTAEGPAAVQLLAQDIGDQLSSAEARVLNGMRSAQFSIFRVNGCHLGTGIDLTDIISGEQIWVVDRGLEASAHAGAELALRLLQPDDFWITTGVVVEVDSAMWRELEAEGVISLRSSPMPSVNRDRLAEAVYRLAAANA